MAYGPNRDFGSLQYEPRSIPSPEVKQEEQEKVPHQPYVNEILPQNNNLFQKAQEKNLTKFDNGFELVGDIKPGQDGTTETNKKTLPTGESVLEVKTKPDQSTLSDGKKAPERADVLIELPGQSLKFDKEGRIESITYPKGDSRSVTYEAGSDKIKSMTYFEKETGKTHEYTRIGDKESWSYKGKDAEGKESRGKWNGSIEYAKDGTFSVKDGQGNGRKVDEFWVKVPTDGQTYREKTNADGSVSRRLSGEKGPTLELNPAGEISKIQSAGGEYRSFARENGQVTGFTDHGADGSIKQQVKDLKNAQLKPDGSLEYTTADGGSAVERADFSRVSKDAQGKLTGVTMANGSSRQFTYDAESGQLAKISDIAKLGTKERQTDWTARRNSPPPDGDGQLTGTFERVNEKTGKVVQTRSDVSLKENGDYSFKDAKDRPGESKVSDRLPSTGDGLGSASVLEARDNFLEVMGRSTKDSERLERLEQMMTGFEKRLADQVELRVAAGQSEEQAREIIEKKITNTYDHLSRMVEPEDGQLKGAIDNKETRFVLAETFMFHAWEPETVNQQGWGSCWLQSGYIPCGLGKNPDDMAKVLADVSLTGKYTDRKGNSYEYSQGQLGIHDRRDGAGWSIVKALEDGSQPSPVAHRFDRTLAVMDRGAGYRGAGNADRIRTGGGGQREIMRRVTGDEMAYIDSMPRNREQRLKLLEAVGAQRDGGRNHVATLALRKVGENWAIVRGDQYDGRDRVVSVIRDLKQWLNNGDHAPIERSFAPSWNKEFKIADAVKPSQFRQERDRLIADNHDDYRPSRPVLAFFRRRRH